MKRITLLFIFLLQLTVIEPGVNGPVYALSGNDLEPKTIKEENKELKYTIDVSYHLLKNYKDKTTEDSFNKYVNDFLTSAIDSFKSDMKDWNAPVDFTSDYEISDTALYNSGDLISMKYYGYEYYAGSAHPLTFFFSVCYDLKNNSVIKLSDMFTGDYLYKISNLCIADLIDQKNDYEDNPDVNWINEGAGPKEENYKIYNFTDISLIITFPVYQVASYAEGPKEVEIPYSKLKNIINPAGPLSNIVR